MTKTITRDELKEKLDRGDAFHLIETLAPGEFERVHIKGAINIQFNRIGTEARRRFNKNDELVLYCSDEDCRASGIAAEKLEGMGFTNVRVYTRGKKDWQDAQLPVE